MGRWNRRIGGISVEYDYVDGGIRDIRREERRHEALGIVDWMTLADEHRSACNATQTRGRFFTVAG